MLSIRERGLVFSVLAADHYPPMLWIGKDGIGVIAALLLLSVDVSMF